MAKRVNLTRKQSAFVAHYMSGESGTDAAMFAYNITNRQTAAVVASENLRKPNITEAIRSLSPKGYILGDSISAIVEGLAATKGVKGQPDHRIRLKASKMGLELIEKIYGV